MITVTVVSILAVFLVVVVAFTLASKRPRIRSIADVEKFSRRVDLESFRNLVDPKEEEYLRQALSGSQFRRLQRARMLAALEYVRCTSHNARILVQFADLARRSARPDIAKAGVELANSALDMRLHSMLAFGVFFIRVLAPSIPLRSSAVITGYGRMCDSMTGLVRLQVPAEVASVQAAL